MQLIAGRTAQEFNCRKKRKGAYWDDRCHATAIDTDQYLMQCLIYIDLNRVRVGVVNHPKDWLHGGYFDLKPSAAFSKAGCGVAGITAGFFGLFD